MQSQRRGYRKKTYLAAFAGREGGHQSIFCMVRDLSPHGARLNLLGGQDLPETLDLEINGRPQRLRAKIVWRGDGEVGVAFLAETLAGRAKASGR